MPTHAANHWVFVSNYIYNCQKEKGKHIHIQKHKPTHRVDTNSMWKGCILLNKCTTIVNGTKKLEINPMIEGEPYQNKKLSGKTDWPSVWKPE